VAVFFTCSTHVYTRFALTKLHWFTPLGVYQRYGAVHFRLLLPLTTQIIDSAMIATRLSKVISRFWGLGSPLIFFGCIGFSVAKSATWDVRSQAAVM
jgi:hypothetical protein